MKITVTNHVTLDGVIQAPADPDEDRRDGFTLGGWAVPYTDDVMGKVMGQRMAQRGALLFGRRTYEHMSAAWRGRTDNPFTEVLDKSTKYVVSNTLTEPLDWENSVLLSGDPGDAVAELKAADGPDLVILGSGMLIQALRRRNLIDEYQLNIFPLVLGQGMRLFPDGPPATFELVESTPTTTGVIITRYAASEEKLG